jgi:hypothetical protein
MQRRQEGPLQEKRGHDRYPITLPIEIVIDGKTHPGQTRDLSLGGMFVHTDAELPFAANLNIRLVIPTLKYEGVLPAVVRWRSGGGIGVAFGSLRARDVHALNQLFRDHRDK